MGTTISVEGSTLERFNDAKKETKDEHVPEMSADSFINALLDTREKVQEKGYGDGKEETERVLDAIENQLHFAQETAGVDEQQLAENIADYLMNEYRMPEKVAGELGGR